MYTDKNLTCVDCGAQFVFTAGEQEFHAQKGFTNEPKRCRDCRANRSAERGGGGTRPMGQAREMFSVTCAQCGQEAQVPFQPRNDRPVYCADCFRSRREESGSYGGGRSGGGRGYGDRW